MKRFWLICLYILASCAWSNAQEVAEIPQHLLLSKGIEYIEQKDYQTAERFLLGARNYYADSRKGVFNEQYTSATYHLGIVYFRLFLLNTAQKYAEEAVTLYSILNGTDDFYFARALNTLGAIYVGMKEYPKAEERFLSVEQILNKLEKSTSDSSSLTDIRRLKVSMYINLASVYEETDRKNEAVYKYFDALKWTEGLPEASMDSLTIMHDLGVLCMDHGEYNLAEQYLVTAHKKKQRLYHLTDKISLRMLSVLYMHKRDFSTCIAYGRQLDSINRINYLQSIQNITSKQLEEQLMYTMGADYTLFFPQVIYHSYSQDPSTAGWGYNNELFIKGLLLQSTNAIKRSIDESNDSALTSQLNELTYLRQTILSLQEKDPYSTLITQYELRAEDLEKQIVVNSAAYRENMQQWSITWDSVRKALKPQQVAIEYMQVPIWEDDMYCALLLRDTCSMPILIPLSKQSEIDSLLPSSTSDSTEIHRTYAYNERGKNLSEREWKGVQYYIHPGDTVFFSPTGILHQIAIENLPYDSTRTMGDVYHLVRLSSTRELVKNRAAIKHQNATLYGNIYYTAQANTMAQAHSNTRYEWIYNLSATKQEIETISAILNEQHIHVDVLSGYKASEESFKSLSGAKQNIIHLATHGFYKPDSTIQDPLEKCGLYFMGANARSLGIAQDIQDAEDGIVTAKDISLMDLRGADIVVLSACETGLGDVTGEGVFGLQRAFKMAGAQTLIMSLWQVDDRATQKLMTAFYRYLSSPGMTKRQAFRAAQQEVRQSGFESPYYWAGFIILD